MSRMKRKVSIILVILCLLGGLALPSRNGSRSALDRYKAGLRAKGEKLTLAELAIPPSTKAEEIASRQILATNPLPQSVIKLSLLMEFIANGKARVAWRGKLHWDPSYTGKTNGPVLGDWAAYDRTNAMFVPYLEQLKPALEHPTPDTGWVYQDAYQSITNGPPRTFVRDRTLAYALLGAEIGELHRGNLDAAIADLHALTGLARLNRNELTLVHQIIRTAIAGLALNATWEVLQAPGWDERRLQALQHEWDQMNLIDAVERGFMAERAFGMVFMGQVRKASGHDLWNVLEPYKTSPAGSGTLSTFWRNAVLAPAYEPA